MQRNLSHKNDEILSDYWKYVFSSWFIEKSPIFIRAVPV